MKHRQTASGWPQWPRAVAAAFVGSVLLAAAACSGSAGKPADAASPVDMASELNKPATLTFWSWVSNIDDEVKLFEQKYPKIKVKVVNAGQPGDMYPKLRTAIKAGSGAPDVAQLEYQEIPSFTITKSLLDLTPYGANGVKDRFVPWAWNQVSQGGKVYGIPQDTGPMGMLYRKDIFDKYGIAVPKTWADFASAAKKLHVAAPNTYLTNLPPNNGVPFNGMMWQAGARPFTYSGGADISVRLNDTNSQKIAGYWSPLVKQGLVSSDPDFTDQWFHGLANGKYATWLTAAWGPMFLKGTAKQTAGKWRAAPLPQWSAGQNVSANWGGSASTVVRGTKYPAAAAALAEFLNTDAASTKTLATEQSLFPATTALLADASFTGEKVPFYGGQTVNQVFADISKTVPTDFTWSPFQDYVYQAYQDTVGKAVTGKTDMTAALAQWQQTVTGYAQKQGFTVTGGN
ncbi:extracellular solute-binding protein [Actinoallomurus sp. NPDC050550]|uniref:extracellular solute-binding protein n=1 Tax=Actinoallomurus sp. NPDC050550 TaxID=3154937 RepID=UPI0033DF7E7D